MHKISVFRIQRVILCCSIDFVSLVCLWKSNKLSTQIERVNHIVSIIHQIERFNQTFIRKSTSIHYLIKLRVIHIQQLDSTLSIIFLSFHYSYYCYYHHHLIRIVFVSGLQLDFNRIAHPIIYLVDLSKPQAIHPTILNLCPQHPCPTQSASLAETFLSPPHQSCVASPDISEPPPSHIVPTHNYVYKYIVYKAFHNITQSNQQLNPLDS